MPSPHRVHPRPALLLLALACACAGDDGGATTDASSDTAASTSGATAAGTANSTTTSSSPTTTGADTSTSAASTSGAPLDCADLPLCDDFEGSAPQGPPDPARWTVVSPDCMGQGALAVDDAVAHSGARSLRVDGAGGYCDHVFIANSAALAALGPVVHGRFFIRLGAALGDGHATFATLEDSADGGKDLRMGGQAKILMWNRESDDATLPVLSPAGIAQSLAPAPESWHCVEFRIDGDAGAIQTWVDGAEVPGLHVDADPTPDIDSQWHQKPGWKPALVDFKLGWESYAGQAMTLWFDDVALAAAPIGCE